MLAELFSYASVHLSLDREGCSLRAIADGDCEGSVYNAQVGIALTAFYYAVVGVMKMRPVAVLRAAFWQG